MPEASMTRELRTAASRRSRTVLPPCDACFFLAAGRLSWGPGAGQTFDVPAGRTVLPAPTTRSLESENWVVACTAH